MLKALAGHHNKITAKATVSKLRNHTWYMSEELVALALFDPIVPSNTKKLMIEAITNREGAEEPIQRIDLKENSIL